MLVERRLLYSAAGLKPGVSVEMLRAGVILVIAAATASHAAAQIVVMKGDDELQGSMNDAVFETGVNLFFDHSGADAAEIALFNNDQYLAPISRNLSAALLPPFATDFGY